ncbi:MAG TPA: hypothetical protein VFZ61_02635 [Polyangiales bacterium]
MTRALVLVAGIALLVFGCGCALDLAVAGGAAIPRHRPDTDAAWSGELRAGLNGAGALHTGVWIVDHLSVGAELQGHAVRERGSNFSAGAFAGLSFADALRNGLIQVDAGAPIGWGSPLQGYYVGGTGALLWSLRARSKITAVNDNFRLFHTSTQIGPLLRYRFQSLDDVRPGQPTSTLHELMLGLQIRVLITTDLL